MLRDRVPSWALEVCYSRGIESPGAPFCSGASLAPCSVGTVGPPVPPLPLFLLGTE